MKEGTLRTGNGVEHEIMMQAHAKPLAEILSNFLILLLPQVLAKIILKSTSKELLYPPAPCPRI
jgi:hypothetical protein